MVATKAKLKSLFSPMAQLSLGLGETKATTLASYFPGEQNRALVSLIRRLLNRVNDKPLGIYGPPGVGKTHLLNAACLTAQDSGIPSGYLPMAELVEEGVSAKILVGLDYLGLICLDDLQSICGNVDWEAALLALCVRIQARAGRVLVAANEELYRLPWKNSEFSDYLVSRFLVFPCFSLKESEKLALLEEHAMTIGIMLPAPVGKFLVKYFAQDTASLLQSIRDIHAHTAGSKRKLSVSLVQEILKIV